MLPEGSATDWSNLSCVSVTQGEVFALSPLFFSLGWDLAFGIFLPRQTCSYVMQWILIPALLRKRRICKMSLCWRKGLLFLSSMHVSDDPAVFTLTFSSLSINKGTLNLSDFFQSSWTPKWQYAAVHVKIYFEGESIHSQPTEDIKLGSKEQFLFK